MDSFTDVPFAGGVVAPEGIFIGALGRILRALLVLYELLRHLGERDEQAIVPHYTLLDLAEPELGASFAGM